MTPAEPTLLSAFVMLIGALLAYAVAFFLLVRVERPPNSRDEIRRAYRRRPQGDRARDRLRARSHRSLRTFADATTL